MDLRIRFFSQDGEAKLWRPGDPGLRLPQIESTDVFGRFDHAFAIHGDAPPIKRVAVEGDPAALYFIGAERIDINLTGEADASLTVLGTRRATIRTGDGDDHVAGAPSGGEGLGRKPWLIETGRGGDGVYLEAGFGFSDGWYGITTDLADAAGALRAAQAALDELTVLTTRIRVLLEATTYGEINRFETAWRASALVEAVNATIDAASFGGRSIFRTDDRPDAGLDVWISLSGSRLELPAIEAATLTLDTRINRSAAGLLSTPDGPFRLFDPYELDADEASNILWGSSGAPLVRAGAGAAVPVKPLWAVESAIEQARTAVDAFAQQVALTQAIRETGHGGGIAETIDPVPDGTQTGARIRLGAGDDRFMGSDANETVNGGTGDDWLFGSGGSDLLIGGRGSDRFVLGSFYGGISSHTIVDFDPTEGDKLQLMDGSHLADWGIEATAEGIRISSWSGSALILGVDEISEADVIF